MHITEYTSQPIALKEGSLGNVHPPESLQELCMCIPCCVP